MKNSKRMLAVIAASGLALGSLPGVANAQSVEPNPDGGSSVLGLDLDVLDFLGVNLDVNLGSSGEPGGSPLASLEELGGTGSDGNGSDSGNGSEGNGSEGNGSDGNGSDSGNGSEGNGSDSGNGSEGNGSEGNGSEGNLSSDSLEPEEPGTEEPGDFMGSLTSLFEDLGSESGTGSDGNGSDGNGSDSGNGSDGNGSDGNGSDGNGSDGNGSEGNLSSDSLEPEEPGTEEPGDFMGSLTDLFDDLGSSNGGSSELGSSDNELDLGSVFEGSSGESGSGSAEDDGDDDDQEPPTGGDNSVELDSETLLAIGSLAAVGIGVGIAVSGGLPALPDVNVGVICDLPQEGVDFLKANGSMEQNECEPEEQN